jgi:hypothetical protein
MVGFRSYGLHFGKPPFLPYIGASVSVGRCGNSARHAFTLRLSRRVFIKKLSCFVPCSSTALLLQPSLQFGAAPAKPHVPSQPNARDPLFLRSTSASATPNPGFRDSPPCRQLRRIDHFFMVSPRLGHQRDIGHFWAHIFNRLEVYRGYPNRCRLGIRIFRTGKSRESKLDTLKNRVSGNLAKGQDRLLLLWWFFV